jgi:methyl-accepting chemotaxis protein
MTKISNWTIGTRLGAGFAGMLLVLLALTAVSLVSLRQIASLQEQVSERGRTAWEAEQWAGLTGTNLARTLAIAKSGGAEAVSAYMQPQIKATSARISELQKDLQARSTDALSARLMEGVGERRKAYIGARDKVFAALKAGETEAAQAGTQADLLPAAQTYQAAIAEYVNAQRELSAEAEAAVARTVTQSMAWAIGLAVAAAALGALLSWRLTRSVTTPLQRAMAAAEDMAAGDLTRELVVDRGDEAGRLLAALAHMQSRLREMVRRIQQSSETMRHATVEIADGHHDLSARTEQSAASLQQTASAMDELSGTVQHSTQAAAEANGLAASACDVARNGGALVSQVVSTMHDIAASSRQIADITGVIDSIAFQTNILALNAAVESARAGEHGRGFAVVAGEVRTLAQRSAAAAKEIKSLIGASVEKVGNGSELVQHAGATMEDLVGSVQRVADIIGEISSAAKEQDSGIAEINKAVNQLDSATQQNAALVEQATAAANALKDQAQALGALVEVFKLPADAPRSAALA